MQLRVEVENPMVSPVKYRFVRLDPVVENTCSQCDCRAKVKIHGERYCWECAEVEGVEKV